MKAALRAVVILLGLAFAGLPLAWLAITSLKPKRFTEAAHLNAIPAVGRTLYGDLDFAPPAAVRDNAAAAVAAWKGTADRFARGLLGERDLALARHLAAGRPVDPELVRPVAVWLAANEQRLKAHRSWAPRGAAWQDWQGRGGDAGRAWFDSLVAAMAAAEAAWEGSIAFPPGVAGYRDLAEPIVASDPNTFYDYLVNSLIIGAASTLAAVLLGTAAAYGFSRFRVPGGKDWLFFILSTRFMPPLAVAVPILLMYRQLGLPDTHLGLVLLYTAFNLSLATWLMKGFIDDIPRAYEEAALVDGYTRLQAFWRVVLPHAATGMAVTAVFCLISAWNEYGFAKILNNVEARTVPVFFAGLQGNIKGVPWHTVAAGSLLFVTPIVVFVVLVRKHLLRGVTFGTVKG